MRYLIAIVALFASVASAQSARTASSDHPDISGYWELRDDSFNVPAASLTPQAAVDQPNQRRRDIEAIRWCINVGVPALMGDRAPLDIRQSPSVTAVVAKSPSSIRYIYTDGRNHPEKDDFDPTTNGHSIGHWEGDTLVVDTTGFNDRGVRSVPGGGVRSLDSHLVSVIVCWKAASGCPSRSRGKIQRSFRSPIPTSSDITKFGKLASPVSSTAIPATRSVPNSC